MTWALVAGWVVLQIQLVILLSSPPLASRDDVGNNAAFPPLVVGFGGDFAGNGLLLCVMEVDSRAVLRTPVGTLGVQRGGIMHLIEELDELTVGDDCWVEHDIGSFGMTSITAADGSVARVPQVATNVADLDVNQALASKVFSVEMLDAPKATCSNGASLGSGGEAHGGIGCDGHACRLRQGFCESREDGEGHFFFPRLAGGEERRFY